MILTPSFSRRSFLSLLGAGAASTLAGCASSVPRPLATTVAFRPEPVEGPSSELDLMYGSMVDGGFVIPAIPYRQINPRYYRQQVVDPTGERPGTVVVDTASRFLYLVEPGGTAMRYGVGIGREGLPGRARASSSGGRDGRNGRPGRDGRPPAGTHQIFGQEWRHAARSSQPLGARALYIFQNGKDTLYRLHGSPEWNSIGKAVSSGCVRLMNQDIIDLYDRVPEKARIVVWQ